MLVTPAARGSRQGNRTTALRWAALLRSLGCRVRVATDWNCAPADLLVAVHARRSAGAVRRFRARHPRRPIVVALAGTDLYLDGLRHRTVRGALEAATRIVVLNRLARRRLPVALARRTRVILQSAPAAARAARRRSSATTRPIGRFDVLVLAHLRLVKDPMRAAHAARLLPGTSRVRVVQFGGARSAALAASARAEMRRNPRFVWRGDRPRAQTLAALARARLVVVSSRAEGGSNALSEALVAGVPVLATRVEGNVGLLGSRYSGLFEPGDTRGLSRLLARAETEARFLARLRKDVRRAARALRPAAERRAWAALLTEVVPPRGADRPPRLR